MAKYTQDSVDRLRDAIDMVDLVGSRTELRRAGASRYEGLCPFHDERTPSFGIDPVNKLYYCFGCGEGGDALKFVQETEGVDFKGALELMADRYGVELQLEHEDPRAAERRKRRERLHELLERTAEYYVRVLWESREAERARQYLLGRGLEEEVLRAFRVGYSPSAWDTVLTASRRARFSNQELYDAGLVQRGRDGGQLYDRFRARIMFPISDLRGRVIGFGARAMGSERGPKYLNTAESELFHKGRQVYGAAQARAAAAKAGSVIVAEGYTDVIALHQAGLTNTVAVMGTALTEDQVRQLRSLAPVAHLALDADEAGQEAMVRAARVAEGEKLELRVLGLPPGSDPADLVAQAGADAVSGLLPRATPVWDFLVARTVDAGDLSTARGREEVLTRVGPILNAVPDGLQREEAVRIVADRLDLTPDLLKASLYRPAAAARAPTPAAPQRAALGSHERVERAFLALCLAMPARGGELLKRADPDEHFAGALTRRAAIHLREHLDDPVDTAPADDAELRELLTELSVRAARETPAAPTLDVEWLQLELRRLERLRAAARTTGTASATELAERREAIKAELDRAIERAVAGA